MLFSSEQAVRRHEADVLVLAVKPQFFPEVISEIRDILGKETLVISVAAGERPGWRVPAVSAEGMIIFWQCWKPGNLMTPLRIW